MADEIPGRTPRERELLIKRARVNTCAGMKKHLSIYFALMIANMIVGAVSIFFAYITVGLWGDTSISGSSFHVTMIVVGGISLLICFGAVYNIFKMNGYYDGFSTSGVFYIVQALSSFLQVFLVESIIAYLFFQGIAALSSVLYLISFAGNMSKVLENIDAHRSERWDNYRKYFIWLLIGTFVCIVICIIPGLAMLGLITLSLVVLGFLGMTVWFMMLVYQSAESMKIAGDREATALAAMEKDALA